MCGIVGRIGPGPSSEKLISGLKHLEYRGYDSAGIAVVQDGRLEIRRCVGRVAALEEMLEEDLLSGTPGIAHTRWATHGRPSVVNAHPHVDDAGRIALVHNGIIENYAALRSLLEQQGVRCVSDTDTEVLVQLIGLLYAEEKSLAVSVREALGMVEGTFGIAVICSDEPNVLVAARNGSPLLLGIGRGGEYFVASDPAAIAGRATQVAYLQDGEMAVLTTSGLEVSTIDERPVDITLEPLNLTLEQIELGAFEHHMHKEIHEQPQCLRNTLSGRIHPQRTSLVLGGLERLERQLPHFRRVLLFGCGSAWHAGLIGEYMIEELASMPTDVQYSSELRYRNPLIEEGTLAVAISQSGETADTLAALQEVRMRGATVLGIVNTVGSTIARETDAGVYLHVGPEVGVASTKAFLGQVTVLCMLAIFLGRRRHLSHETISSVLTDLAAVPDAVAEALLLEDQVREIAHRLADRGNWLYLGRGINYPTALEGALKLKEVSYLHAEGLPAAEMKHGPIAMIDEGMPVVVIAPRDVTYPKILSNIEEVRSRGGHVIAVVNQPDSQLERLANDIIQIPSTAALLSPLVASVPLQLLAYHAALVRNLDVDKPRNLAKSVTVE